MSAALAAAILIGGAVSAVMHLALPFAGDLLIVFAIVGTLGCAVYFVVHGRPRSLAPTVAGFLAGATVPVELRVLGTLADTSLSRPTDYLADPKVLLLAGLAGAIVAPAFARLLSARAKIGRLGLALLTAVGLALLWLAPLAVKARSCHNPSRHSAKSVSPVAEFEVRVPVVEWALLRRELVRYASDGGWQVWSDVRADPSFPWFEVSLCRRSGTELFFLLNPQKMDALEVDVYQPQGGNGWQQAVQAVQARIARRWPRSIGSGEAPDPAFTPWPPDYSPRPLLRQRKSL